MSKMQKHIHESNLIEGYDDPEFDKQSMVAWEFLAKQEKIDRAVVCEVQRLIVNPQTDLSASERGNYRYVTVYVGDYTTPNSMRIPELMESWLNNMAFFFDHTPKELHIEFERIHPFIDGNGRTGRMLMWWHEIKLGQKPTLIRNATKQRYYEWFKATDVSSSESSGEPPTLRKLAPVSPNTNIDEILKKAFNDYYDYITEKDIIKAAHEYSEKTVFKEAKTQLEALIAAAKIEELESLSFAVVEPCEPECDEVRHALHEGSWNAHLKIEERIKELESYKEGQ